MRTLVGNYATIYYPYQYIYSEDVCNIFCKFTNTIYTGEVFFLVELVYSSVTPSGYSKTIQVRLQGDAQGNAFIDIAPYNRAMVTECAGTLARIILNITVHVATEETLNLLPMRLEPGIGRINYTSGTYGEAVQPPRQVMCTGLGNYVTLLFDLQNTQGDGKLQRNNAGVWEDYLTLTELANVHSQIKPLVTAELTASEPMQYRVLNYTGAVVWQGVVDSVGEACSADKWAFVEWRADQWLNKKSWNFKIKSITRKVTGSQDLALQPFVYDTADYYNTHGVNERNGQGFNRQKNWQVQMQVVVDGLTERELMYFNDLFTSPEVYVKSDALGAYGSTNLNLVQAAVDGNSLQTTFKVERASMTFTLLIADFKQY